MSDVDPVAAMDGDADAADVEAADDGVEERDPFKRRVAVVLAVLGVVGGWIGILRIDAATNESFYARETTRTAVQSLRANVNQSTVEGLEIDLDAERAALGLAAPFREDGLGGLAGATVSPEQQLAEEEAIAAISSQDREVIARQLTQEAERLDLTRSALAETRVTYNNRTSQYETVLTTLAVALFLVGFTLVLGKRTRPPVLVPGLLLAAYVAGWAIWIHQRDIPTTSEVAIESAATAGMHTAFGEFREAEVEYTNAIEEDDDFVAAYTGRSIASFLAANPDFQTNLAVVDAEGELAAQALADAEEAVELGQDNDFASLLVSGIYRFYAGDYDGAVDRLQASTEINTTAPEAYFLLAAAELARGEVERAGDAADAGVELLDTTGASDQNRAYTADLFTLLEQVGAAVPEQADAAAQARSDLAAAEAALVFGPDGLGDGSGGSFELVEATFADGVLDTTIAYEGLPEGAAVSIYVYERPGPDAAFVQAAELARFAELDAGSGELSGSVDLVRSCEPVELRYDLYVNGEPAASLEADGVPAQTC
ncbi:MAG: hypothetical protein AAGK32_00140 [Actinomycetota bacterium]